ncbi:MAG: DUF3109 family protein [Bacteroidota bacterium]|nr:DUF3109 family protein [Bacteroidota bacterium]
MFQLGNAIVSEDILEKEFVCNINACKGACCIEGDAGAPLSKSELDILDDIFPKIKSFLRPEAIESISRQGKWVVGLDGEYETPLLDGKDCVYVVYDNNIASCAIEKAYNQGVVNWKKPISCHLYPIRIKEYNSFSAINYHRWYVCDDACKLGKSLQMPLYKFLKEPLIRKYGEDWYAELEQIALEFNK